MISPPLYAAIFDYLRRHITPYHYVIVPLLSRATLDAAIDATDAAAAI